MDKTQEYTKSIEPLLQQVFDSCIKHDIPFIAISSVQVDDETSAVRTTNASLRDAPVLMTLIMMLLHEPAFFATVEAFAEAFLEQKFAEASDPVTLQ